MKLKKAELQYQVVHKLPTDFTVGEEVFLKSNPEVKMTVSAIGRTQVMCQWKNIDGKTNYQAFPPQCILQYLYAGLLTWKEYPLFLN